MSLLKAPVECDPLCLLEHNKFVAECRDDIGDFGFSSPKGKANGLGQVFPGEVELSGEQPDVVEILHSAV